MDHVNLCPRVLLLSRGWIAFKFGSEVDAAVVLASVWIWDHAELLLKHWMLLFDPRNEGMT